MQLMNESGALRGRQRHTTDDGVADRHETRRFVLWRPCEDGAVAVSHCEAGQGAAKCVGRIDARLCPEGRIPSLDAIIDPPVNGGESIKTGEVSAVHRVQWAGLDVVVKRYNHVGLVHSLRHMVKKSRACRGWLNGQRLLELGFHTPRPVAYFDEYRGPLLWRSYLVTEYVDGRRLNELLRDVTVSLGQKRRAIRQVLRLIQKLSLHGINHGDTKHTNILYVDGRAVLTDLDGIETHHWGWLHRRRQAVDIARFLEDVSGTPVRKGEDDVSGILPVEPGSDRRQTFVRDQTAGGWMYVDKDYQREEGFCEALRGGLEGIRDRYASTAVPSSINSQVVRFAGTCRDGQRTMYFKEYVKRSPLDWLKGLVFGNRAIRAFRASLLLAKAGLLSPTVVAAGWAGHNRFTTNPFLVTEEVTDAHHACRHLVSPGPDCTLRDRRELLRSIGRTIGQMHGAGIVHGDLRPGNVLARRTAGGWEFFFIDNERTRKWPWIPKRLRLKNLVQINMLPPEISRTDRMRFFRAYMMANPSVCASYKRWVERIAVRTHQRFRRKGWV